MRRRIDHKQYPHKRKASPQPLVTGPPRGNGEEGEEVDGREDRGRGDATGGEEEGDEELAHEVDQGGGVLVEALADLCVEKEDINLKGWSRILYVFWACLHWRNQ